MRSIYCALFMFLGTQVMGQQEIAFRPLSFDQLRAEAGKENKLIFIDCYTSWCGPCKWMEQNIFTTKEAAAFYNANFINCKFDMEKGEGRNIARKYKVSSFPTYLFVDSAGEIVHRSGSRMTLEEFLKEGESAMDPYKNSASVRKQYENGNRDFAFLLNAYPLMKKNDANISKEIARYFETSFPAEQFNTPLGWRVIQTFFYAEQDRFAQHFIHNRRKMEQIAGKSATDSFETRVKTVSIYRFINTANEKEFFEKLPYFSESADIGKRRAAISFEAEFYVRKKDIQKFEKLMNEARHGLLKTDADRLVVIIRRVGYQAMGDTAFGPICYELAKQALALKPDEYGVLSTYAQVCLSNKKKEEGLAAAKKAKAMAYTTKAEGAIQKLIDELEQL